MGRKLYKLVSSKKFFYFIVGFFVFQALWIALSGRYPMAFDEDFHLGVIRLYAHRWLPFWDYQPSGADAFGAVARDPSYLYHYLLSFPYRLISLVTHSEAIQVLIVRLFNIGLFTTGLVLYRRLMLRIGASKVTAHLVLSLFVLIPIVPFLAAQINYDNLVLPLTALSLLLVIKLNEDLNKSQLNLQRLGQFIVLGTLTSLVKYAFLPIVVAEVVFLFVQIYRTFKSSQKFRPAVAGAWRTMTRSSHWLLVAGLILSTGLAFERYGLNAVRYHELAPDCGQVLTLQQCSRHGPWKRDYELKAIKDPSKLKGPVAYSGDWLHGMWLRSFFSLAGPELGFETRGPLPLPGLSSVAALVLGFIVLPLTAKRLWRRYDAAPLSLMTIVTSLYLGVLWLEGYRAYLEVGKPVAINGRYLLPVLLLIMTLLALAYAEALASFKTLRLWLSVSLLICLMLGGGWLTYVLRSREAWYWPNRYVVNSNRFVSGALRPIIPGANKPTLFLR